MTQSENAATSDDTETENAKARPQELIDKLDDIMATPPEHTGVEQRPLSTSPNNEAEQQEGAIATQDEQGRNPATQDSGG